MRETLERGALGTASSFLAVGISLAAVESWLRIASLLGGVIVAALTIIRILRDWNRR
jgi:hypothetical protein